MFTYLYNFIKSSRDSLFSASIGREYYNIAWFFMQYLGADINKENAQKINFLEAEFTKTPLNQARILKLIELGAHFGRAEAQEHSIEVLSNIEDLTIITKLIEKKVIDVSLNQEFLDVMVRDKINETSFHINKDRSFSFTAFNTVWSGLPQSELSEVFQNKIMKSIEQGIVDWSKLTPEEAIEILSVAKKSVIDGYYQITILSSLFLKYPEFTCKIAPKWQFSAQYHPMLTEAFLAKDLTQANRYIKCGNTHLKEVDKIQAIHTAIDQGNIETMKALLQSKIISIYQFKDSNQFFDYAIKNKSPYEALRFLLENKVLINKGLDKTPWRKELLKEAVKRKDYEFINFCIVNCSLSINNCLIEACIQEDQTLIDKYKDSVDKLGIFHEALNAPGLITSLVSNKIININDKYNYHVIPRSLLNIAIRIKPCYDVIKELLELGADQFTPEQHSSYGYGYMSLFIRESLEKRDYALLRICLQKQIVLRLECLLEAVEAGEINFANEIVTSFGEEAYMFDALSKAMEKRSPKLIELLIEHKIVTDINCLNNTPIRLTILDLITREEYDYEVTKTLIMLGAKSNLQESEKDGMEIPGMSKFVLSAIRVRDYEILEVCVKNKLINGRWLIEAHMERDERLIKILTDGGLAFNHQDVWRFLKQLKRLCTAKDITKLFLTNEFLSVNIEDISTTNIPKALEMYQIVLNNRASDSELFTILYEKKDKVIELLRKFTSAIGDSIEFYENKIAADIEIGNDADQDLGILENLQKNLIEIDTLTIDLAKTEHQKAYIEFERSIGDELSLMTKPSSIVSRLPIELVGNIAEFCGAARLKKSFAPKETYSFADKLVYP